MLRVSKALNTGCRGEVPISLGGVTMKQKMSVQDETITHVKLAQEWNQLLTNIRAIAGFEDFLPPSCVLITITFFYPYLLIPRVLYLLLIVAVLS